MSWAGNTHFVTNGLLEVSSQKVVGELALDASAVVGSNHLASQVT